ncbi:DUF4270 domain-containing protein [Hymenobacter sp. 15J16-1T3B]|uniref:DUF4270 family protein n=1 Tax=Hymenobacter sp. 15J16-1T3B TaxID=2886941 RepID=UPI001D0F4E21|nr:DUF4270 family protein [Hymenobacter sp. 15J16-1T3B]MCC3155619.1 DUF4270 domain-containing protein [Hymenobacter sp. 15J16-1T3B]
MSRPTKPLRRAARAGLGAALLVLAGWLAGCEAPGTDFENVLPAATTTLGANYTDTITVRTSTVLTDSVASSTSGYLLLGRYHDARLGTITARSYLQPGLNDAGTPEAEAVFDSVVLVLATDAYRYGDTTRTQQLRVHRLQTDLRGTATYYTADARPYDATPLGEATFRARKQLTSLRVRLDAGFGQQLFAAAQQGTIGTADELLAQLPGLVLTPGPTDDAALLRFTVATSALQLYYHLPWLPDAYLSVNFPVSTGPKHFYQLEADRRGSLLSPLTTLRQTLPSARTAEETYIEAGLGLQTKVELPYLAQLKQLGGNLVVNSAVLEAEVTADSENPALPPPAALVPRLTDAGNHLGAYFLDGSGNVLSANYQRGISPRTGLERGTYAVPLTAYCAQVLASTRVNHGVLLGSGTNDAAERVVLGSRQHAAAPMKLRLYFTRVSL